MKDERFRPDAAARRVQPLSGKSVEYVKCAHCGEQAGLRGRGCPACGRGRNIVD